MPRSRPPKAAGSYGLLDMVRQPSRLSRIPPAPDASLGDIAAIERGDARRVSCYLRCPPGSGRRGARQGALELTAASVSWRPFPSRRRAARVLDIAGVRLVRPADQSDQRFGSPGNLHLLSLIRCATPAGPLDLLVPTADLPLVTWRLGGGDVPPGAVSGPAARAGRRPPSSRETRRLGLTALAGVAIAVALIAAGHDQLAIVPMNFGALLLMISVFDIIKARWYRRSTREKSGHKGA